MSHHRPTGRHYRKMSSPENLDYYGLLDVTGSATQEEIRKAYRKQALKFHPDKNKDDPDAESMFILISRAYDVLSDPEKKQVYDRYGVEGLEGGTHREYTDPGFSGHHFPHFQPFMFRSPEDIFKEFFGSSFPFGGDDPFFSQGLGAHSMFGNDPFFHQDVRREHRTMPAHRDPFAMQMQMGFPGFMSQSAFGGPPSMGGNVYCQSSSYSGSYGGGLSGANSVSTTTTIVNGKQQTVRRTVKNGVENVEVTHGDQGLAWGGGSQIQHNRQY